MTIHNVTSPSSDDEVFVSFKAEVQAVFDAYEPDEFLTEGERGSKPTAKNAADLFIRTFGREVRWVQAERKWYLCSRTTRPGYWSHEDREGVTLRMQAVAAVLTNTVRMALVREALAIAQARTQVAISPDAFNANPMLLGTPGLVVNMDAFTREEETANLPWRRDVEPGMCSRRARARI